MVTASKRGERSKRHDSKHDSSRAHDLDTTAGSGSSIFLALRA
jgi:hypothetical protein